jgi:hypothetical protein
MSIPAPEYYFMAVRTVTFRLAKDLPKIFFTIMIIKHENTSLKRDLKYSD